LQRLSSSGHSAGSITLASTLTVLRRAAATEHLPDRAAMRDTYKRLRELGDGLAWWHREMKRSQSLSTGK
jgi:hypothetical protein